MCYYYLFSTFLFKGLKNVQTWYLGRSWIFSLHLNARCWPGERQNVYRYNLSLHFPICFALREKSSIYIGVWATHVVLKTFVMSVWVVWGYGLINEYSTQFWLTNIQLNLSVLESTNPGFFFKIWLWRIQRWNVYALLTCHGISWCFCCFTFVVCFLCAAGNRYFDFCKNKDCFEPHRLVLKLCNQIVF